MGVKVKRRYFTKAQKVSILNELSISGLSLSELSSKYQSVVSELEKTKQENECLKKALGELVVERQILKSANEVLKKTGALDLN